jgi:hypothetical protein
MDSGHEYGVIQRDGSVFALAVPGKSLQIRWLHFCISSTPGILHKWALYDGELDGEHMERLNKMGPPNSLPLISSGFTLHIDMFTRYTQAWDDVIDLHICNPQQYNLTYDKDHISGDLNTVCYDADFDDAILNLDYMARRYTYNLNSAAWLSVRLLSGPVVGQVESDGKRLSINETIARGAPLSFRPPPRYLFSNYTQSIVLVFELDDGVSKSQTCTVVLFLSIGLQTLPIMRNIQFNLSVLANSKQSSTQLLVISPSPLLKTVILNFADSGLYGLLVTGSNHFPWESKDGRVVYEPHYRTPYTTSFTFKLCFVDLPALCALGNKTATVTVSTKDVPYVVRTTSRRVWHSQLAVLSVCTESSIHPNECYDNEKKTTKLTQPQDLVRYSLFLKSVPGLGYLKDTNCSRILKKPLLDKALRVKDSPGLLLSPHQEAGRPWNLCYVPPTLTSNHNQFPFFEVVIQQQFGNRLTSFSMKIEVEVKFSCGVPTVPHDIVFNSTLQSHGSSEIVFHVQDKCHPQSVNAIPNGFDVHLHSLPQRGRLYQLSEKYNTYDEITAIQTLNAPTFYTFSATDGNLEKYSRIVDYILYSVSSVLSSVDQSQLGSAIVVTSMDASASDYLKGTPFKQPTLTLRDHNVDNSSYPILNWVNVEHSHWEVEEDVCIELVYSGGEDEKKQVPHLFFLSIVSDNIRFKVRSGDVPWQSGIYETCHLRECEQVLCHLRLQFKAMDYRSLYAKSNISTYPPLNNQVSITLNDGWSKDPSQLQFFLTDNQDKLLMHHNGTVQTTADMNMPLVFHMVLYLVYFLVIICLVTKSRYLIAKLRSVLVRCFARCFCGCCGLRCGSCFSRKSTPRGK